MLYLLVIFVINLDMNS